MIPQENVATQAALTLTLLYEDEYLVAIDKPAWSVVHPTRGARDALIITQRLTKQLGVSIYPIHRLDRQTSGVLLLAKSPTVANTLSQEIREGRMRKSYLGLCRGLIHESQSIDHPVPEDDARRSAFTEVEPLEHFCQRYTLLRARPLTGRRHQIRYHLKHINHPLAGDVKYGKGDINRFFRSTFGLGRFFLHAESIQIIHPVQLRYIELSCPLAPDLEQVLNQLRNYTGPIV